MTAVAAVTVPLATEAGEALEHALPRSPAIATHAHLGDELLPFTIALLVLTAALMLLDRRRQVRGGLRREIDPRSAPGTVAGRTVPSTVMRLDLVVTALLTVAVAAVCAVQVVRIGDSGARAAWGDQTYLQQAAQDDDR